MKQECKECDYMLNFENVNKWGCIEKCPTCGKDTQILKDNLKNSKAYNDEVKRIKGIADNTYKQISDLVMGLENTNENLKS